MDLSPVRTRKFNCVRTGVEFYKIVDADLVRSFQFWNANSIKILDDVTSTYEEI